MRSWEVLEHALEQDLALVSRGVIEFGRGLAVAGKAKAVACLVREGKTIIAGRTGKTEYSRLFVNYLWVTGNLRGQGLGTAVLDRLESEALIRGCTEALLETLDDRTARLYGRLGYNQVGTVARYVGPFTKYIMVKVLRPHKETSGV